MPDGGAVKCLFQSTPPVKAATAVKHHAVSIRDISIHAAREGGDFFANLPERIQGISIHAAREGGDMRLRLKQE